MFAEVLGTLLSAYQSLGLILHIFTIMHPWNWKFNLTSRCLVIIITQIKIFKTTTGAKLHLSMNVRSSYLTHVTKQKYIAAYQNLLLKYTASSNKKPEDTSILRPRFLTSFYPCKLQGFRLNSPMNLSTLRLKFCGSYSCYMIG